MSIPVPPSWKDLGKSSNDLLSKDFPISGAALEVKTKTPSNVTFKVAGFRDTKSSLINGDIEAKYSDPKNGFTYTQAWTTTNLIRAQVELENQIAKGLKLDVFTSVVGDKDSRKNVVVNATYKQPGLHSRAFVDVLKGPIFTADAVVGRDGFLAGAEASYNVTDGRITRYAAAVGFSAPEYAVTLHGLGNFNTFGASYYHRVSRQVEAGAKAVYDGKAPTAGMSLEVGAKASLDPTAYVKGKINNSGLAVLSYTQTLREGVKASFGLALDTQHFNTNSAAGVNPHRVGASFVFES